MLDHEGNPWWFSGPGAALLTLAVWRDIQVSTAVGLLVAAAGLQAFAYAGFHSYAQDVCPKVCPSDLCIWSTAAVCQLQQVIEMCSVREAEQLSIQSYQRVFN